MNLTEIQDLIKFVAKSGVNEVEIEQKDFKIVIKSDQNKKKRGVEPVVVQQVPVVSAPVAIPATPVPTPAAPVTPAAENVEDDSKYVTIKSPMIGTFYRSSSPDKDAFVSIGDPVKSGDIICIIEAMKLFNEIESEISGRIVKVLVDDASPVEYDQPLFLVDPS